MSKENRQGLALMLFIIFGMQLMDTPFLMNKGWLVVVVIVLFNVGAISFIVNYKTKGTEKLR